MGCVSSKSFKKDPSRDIVVVINNGGNCVDHVVSLTSSTLGLLNLDKEVSVSETEARKQSNSRKSNSSPSDREPEVINAWELMEGLEEGGPGNGKSEKSPKARAFLRGFADLEVKSPMRLLTQIGSPKKSKRLGGKENQFVAGATRYSPKGAALKPINSDFSRSPVINLIPPAKVTPARSKGDGSSEIFRSPAVNLILPENGTPAGSKTESFAKEGTQNSQIFWSPAVNLIPPEKGTPVGSKRETFTIDGSVSSAKRSFSPLFDPKLIASVERELSGEEQIKKMVSPSPRARKQRKSTELSESILNSFEKILPPGGQRAAVIYTTTLRGIRKTFEDCNKVRSIIESHDILVFERDVSMDSGFKSELRKLMGTREVKIPAVFVKGRFVGGAEEVVRLEEEGKLGILFEGIERAVIGCEGCGGFRFVMCRECDGSCKVLSSVEKKMVRCGDCNENGLVQCSICCCVD